MEAEENDIFDLFTKTIDGNLSEAEEKRLDDLISRDANLRRAYLEYAHQNACLYFRGIEAGSPDLRELEARPGAVGKMFCFLRTKYLCVGACLLFLLAGFYLRDRMIASEREVVVAKLIKVKNGTFGSGTLPTEAGSTLPRGTLKLNSGIAIVQFTSGAKVEIEAPAQLNLISPEKCRLIGGKIFVKVPSRAVGFKVETESAVITDLGTAFGVYVDRKLSNTIVRVFDGIVDVEQRGGKEIRRLHRDDCCFVNSEKFDVEPGGDFNADNELPGIFGFGPDTMRITTTEGRGRDGHVNKNFSEPVGLAPYLKVKNDRISNQHTRKAYLAFDLTGLEGEDLKQARIQLQVIRIGSISAMSAPDAVYSVYGITDEKLDDWDVDTLNWNNAPANVSTDGTNVPGKAELIGQFKIRQNHATSLVSVGAGKLVDFLNRDTNGIASFVVSREPTEGRGRAFILAFAGGVHPEEAPPALLLELN